MKNALKQPQPEMIRTPPKVSKFLGSLQRPVSCNDSNLKFIPVLFPSLHNKKSFIMLQAAIGCFKIILKNCGDFFKLNFINCGKSGSGAID